MVRCSSRSWNKQYQELTDSTILDEVIDRRNIGLAVYRGVPPSPFINPLNKYIKFACFYKYISPPFILINITFHKYTQIFKYAIKKHNIYNFSSCQRQQAYLKLSGYFFYLVPMGEDVVLLIICTPNTFHIFKRHSKQIILIDINYKICWK